MFDLRPSQKVKLSAGRTLRFSSSTRQETGATIDGPALRRVERNCSLLTTLRALHGDLNALTDSRCLRRGNCCQPFVFRLLTRLAALGFVLQTLVVEKGLFSRCPDEILVTVYAPDRAIGIFWGFALGGHFQFMDFFPV